MPGRQAIIWIVDDDPAIRASLDSLLRAKGYRVQTFKSAGDFLDSEIPDEPGLCSATIRSERPKGSQQV